MELAKEEPKLPVIVAFMLSSVNNTVSDLGHIEYSHKALQNQ